MTAEDGGAEARLAAGENQASVESQTTDENQVAKVFKALGHPTRIKIVEHLIRCNSCICGEIVDIFPYSQSTISQHLKILKESRIVCGEIDGPKTCYCIDKNILKRIKEYVEKL